jgi:hypothetical protein
MGEIDVLSVGRGHNKVEVGNTPEDVEKARTMIEDMLKRGYSIFVEDPKTGDLKRVKKFNPKKMMYLIDAPVPGAEKVEVPVKKSKATAVGRTAGG